MASRKHVKVKKRNKKTKMIIIMGVAIVIPIVVALVAVKLGKDIREAENEAKEQELLDSISSSEGGSAEATDSLEEEKANAFEGKEFFSNIDYNNEIIVDVSQVMPIYDVEPIKIDDETANTFINKLTTKGWSGHKLIVMSNNGGYKIYSDEEGDGFSSKENFAEFAEEFMEYSGLYTFFLENSIEVISQVDPDDGKNTMYYKLSVDDMDTGSYIELTLAGENVCTECMIYLLSGTAISAVDSISFEEAVDYAFYIEDEYTEDMSSYEFTVETAELKYINGLPYYCFVAEAEDGEVEVCGYASAIPYEEIVRDEALLEKFIDFSS